MSELSNSLTQTARLQELNHVALEDYIIDFSWSPDSKKIAAVTVEGFVFLIKPEEEMKSVSYQKIGKHDMGGNSVSWRFDGQEFATAGQDGLVKVWDGISGESLCSLSAGNPWVAKVAYNPRNKTLASVAGRHLKIWTDSRSISYESSEHASTVADMAWNPDGSGLAVAAYYGVTLHAPRKQKKPRKYVWKGSSVALAWSPDANYIVTGEQDSTVHFWYRKSGEDAQMSGFPTKVLELSWDPTGRWLATGGGVQISLWDCSGQGPAGRAPRMYEGHANKLTHLAFQPEGKYLVSSDLDSLLLLWAPLEQDKMLGGTKLDAPANLLKWGSKGKLAVAQENGDLVFFTLQHQA